MSEHPTSEKPLVWHPVSKQLPAYGVEVLVTAVNNKRTKTVFMAQRYRTDCYGDHWKDDHHNDVKTHSGLRVLAWMPKPEHYRGN